MRRSGNPGKPCRHSMPAGSTTVDSGKHHPGFRHGVYRWHGRQCGAACSTEGIQRRRGASAMGGRILRVAADCLAATRGQHGGSFRSPQGICRRRGIIRRRIRLLWAVWNNRTIDLGTGSARRGRRIAGAGKPGPDQRLVPGKHTRQGDRHVVGLHRHDGRAGPRSRRLPDRTCFMALCFSDQCPVWRLLHSPLL